MSAIPVTFNIETIPDPNLPEDLKPKPEDMRVGNVKDPAKIEAAIREKMMKAYSTLGTDPLTGKIICLAVKIGDAETQVTFGHNEAAIVDAFLQVVNNDEGFIRLVGFNSKHFDFNFLRLSALRLGRAWTLLPSTWNNRYKSDAHFDVMDELSDEWVSLDKWATRMGVVRPIHNGSEIAGFYADNDWGKITEHCKSNVESTYALYKLLTR